MSTTTSFDTMLKKYMPYKLLREEMIKRDYFLLKVEKDQKWKGGDLEVPFKGGKASSFAFGQLTAQADITEDKPVLGTVSAYKEIWGSMIFNDHDLNKHDSMEQSFIKILPDTIEEFVDDMKQVVSINLLNGGHIVSLSNGEYADQAAMDVDLALGTITVDRPARLQIGQYLELGIEGDPATSDLGAAVGYVKQIIMSTGKVILNSEIGLGGAVPDFSAGADPLLIAVANKAFIRGGITAANTFTALRVQTLSAANGGSANLFGINKLLYPHLQAYNADGSSITAANVLEKIFDAYNDTRQIGKGAPTDVLMSYKHLSNVMKSLEKAASGTAYGRQYTASDAKASVFGWTEIDVVGVKGQLKLVGINEMDDDIMHIVDWRSMKLHSNGMFERRTSPEGSSFYEVRATTGYKYIVDTRFFGELVVSKPSHNGIIHSISY